MRYIWRRLMGRCVCCGQQLKGGQTAAERMEEINARGSRLAELLERAPMVQSCSKCGKMVFEGEPGFVPSILLIDIDYPCPRLWQGDGWRG